MVDSIFPNLVSFQSLMVLSFVPVYNQTLIFDRNLHPLKKNINRDLHPLVAHPPLPSPWLFSQSGSSASNQAAADRHRRGAGKSGCGGMESSVKKIGVATGNSIAAEARARISRSRVVESVPPPIKDGPTLAV
jgi:hypothetical protein